MPHRARGYVRAAETGELRNSALADISYKVPGGGLCGTAPDVARFGLALVSGRLVGQPRCEQMLTPQRLRTGRPQASAWGSRWARAGAAREAWHTGGQERVSTRALHCARHGLVVVLLSNLEHVQTPLLNLGRRVSIF